MKTLNQMTGFLKNRILHGQAKKAFVRPARTLLGNFTQFSITEKLWVPGAFGGCCTTLWGQDWSGDSEGSVQDGLNTRKKKQFEKQSCLRERGSLCWRALGWGHRPANLCPGEG